jgi:hypothetical protein
LSMKCRNGWSMYMVRYFLLLVVLWRCKNNKIAVPCQ